jgi:hypothetical protein
MGEGKSTGKITQTVPSSPELIRRNSKKNRYLSAADVLRF